METSGTRYFTLGMKHYAMAARDARCGSSFRSEFSPGRFHSRDGASGGGRDLMNTNAPVRPAVSLTYRCSNGHLPRLLAQCELWLAQRGGRAEKLRAFEPLRPEEIAARFPQLEILELLGRGCRGAVCKARQTELDRLVALKTMPPSIALFRELDRRLPQ